MHMWRKELRLLKRPTLIGFQQMLKDVHCKLFSKYYLMLKCLRTKSIIYYCSMLSLQFLMMRIMRPAPITQLEVLH